MVSITVDRDDQYTGIDVYDHAETLVFSDYCIDTKTYSILKPQLAKIVITIGDNQYVYNYPHSLSSVFTLSLSPSSGAIGDPIAATLNVNAGAPAYPYISWFVDGALYNTYYLNETDSTWYEYDSFTGTYSHASTATAAKTQSIPFSTEGTHSISCRVYDADLNELASPAKTATISGQFTSPTTSISANGFVYDVTTGTTVDGVTVAAAQSAVSTSSSDTTDDAGYFSLSLKSDYPVSITASKDGYVTQTIEYTTVPRLSPWPLAIYVWPDTAPPANQTDLYGQVVASGSMQCISGANVTLSNSSWSDSTTSTSTGYYEFTDLADGQYTLTGTAPGHSSVTELVTASGSTTHNLALDAIYTLNVTVKDADSTAVITNSTTISLTDGQEATTSTGTASFTVGYGSYTATAASQGYYPSSQYAFVDRDATITIHLTKQSDSSGIGIQYPPHNVKFTLKTIWGSPIQGATIVAQGTETTAGAIDWFKNLLGIDTEKTPITDTQMIGHTDVNGEITFMMIESVKYHITVTSGDQTQEFDIYPQDDNYPITLATSNAWLPEGGDSLASVRVNVTTSTDGDVGHILVHYNDSTAKTTALTVQVTQLNATADDDTEDVIDTYTVSGESDVSHTFDLSEYKGESFFVRLNATHPDFGNVERDYGVAFKGVRVPLGNIDDDLYIYIAAFALILLGCLFGATSSHMGMIVVVFAAWLFFAFGWLDDLGLSGPIALSFATVVAIVAVITKRSREEGYT